MKILRGLDFKDAFDVIWSWSNYIETDNEMESKTGMG